MSNKITQHTTKLEKSGNGEAIVSRWLYNWKERHMITIKNGSTVAVFHREIAQRLDSLREPDLGNFGK
jgi:hypothetical protein